MRVTSLAAAVCLSVVGFVAAQDAEAIARRHTNIPAQGLGPALQTLAQERGFQVVYLSDPVDSLQTAGAVGEFTDAEAIEVLLAGTKLTYRFLDDTTVMVISAAAAEASTTPLKRTSNSNASTNGAMRLAQTETREARKVEVSRTLSSPPETSISSQGEDDQSSKGLPEIVVRGSRVLNMDLKRSRDDAQPYVVFDSKTIEQSGATTVENFLRERLPMNAAGLENSQRVTQGGSRSSFNLRGLGPGQTLILIDGHRTASGPAFGGSPAQPDINGIPLAAIERIEILPATSSGIYGGNATGGVINVITRQDYSGVEIRATYGNAFEGDASQQRYELLAGTALEGGKTKLTFAASYSVDNPMSLGDRRALVERYYNIARANDPASIFPPGSPPLGSTPNIRSVDGSDLVLDDDTPLNSSFTFVPFGYTGVSDGGVALVANAGQYNFELPNVHQFYTGAHNQLGQETKSSALRAAVQRQFSERVRGFFEANYSETDTNGRGSMTSGSALAPYLILADAPTNPFTTDIQVTVPTDSFATPFTTETTTSRVMGGAIVDLGRGWNAEADYTWAEDKSSADIGSLFTMGGDFVGIMTGGIEVLRDTGLYPVDLSPYLAEPATFTPQKVTFNDLAVRFSGPMFDIPAGPVMFSSLLEYREEKFSETVQVLPGLFTILYPDHSARTYSAYVETRFPLRKNLELQVAGRFDKYRTFGKTGFVIVEFGEPIVSANNTMESVNPTIALRYQPIDDVGLRLSWGTGFVPPDASQLASTQLPLFEVLTDPRRGDAVVSTAGTFVLQGGNPDLKPEESENWSAGVIFTPRWAPGLRVSLDYVHIKKTDNIAFYPTGLQGILNDEALFPTRVERGANLPGDPPGWAGPVTIIDSTLFNIARAEVEAVDVQLDYTWTTAIGDFGLSAVASKQLHYKTEALAGEPTVENVGNGYHNPQELNGNAQLSWSRNGWNAGWSMRFYDSYFAVSSQSAATAPANVLQGNGGRVPGQTYHDAFVSYRFDSRRQGVSALLNDSEVRLGVRNVFDELPPFDAGLFLLVREYYSPLGDALRRNFSLSISKQF